MTLLIVPDREAVKTLPGFLGEWSLFTAGGRQWNSENRSHSKRAPSIIAPRQIVRAKFRRDRSRNREGVDKRKKRPRLPACVFSQIIV